MCIMICECWPIQSVNKTQCPIHFWSSEVQLKTNLISGCSRRVCYYTNWSQYSPGYGRFVPENVSPFLCTHVVYAFAKLRGNHLEVFEWNDKSTDCGPRACKSSSETAAVVVAFPSWTLWWSSGILYTVVCGHAFHRVRRLHVWNPRNLLLLLLLLLMQLPFDKCIL